MVRAKSDEGAKRMGFFHQPFHVNTASTCLDALGEAVGEEESQRHNQHLNHHHPDDHACAAKTTNIRTCCAAAGKPPR
jgi:hypothetical protein